MRTLTRAYFLAVATIVVTAQSIGCAATSADVGGGAGAGGGTATQDGGLVPEGGSALTITPDAGADAPSETGELCNGADDDGDGSVDEGCVCTGSATQKCFVGKAEKAGKGACTWGTQTCVVPPGGGEFSIGAWGECVGSGAVGVEACNAGVGNGKDDDCDGVVDNGCASCTPEAEVCDNAKDDDCDGVVDEGCSSCVPTTSCAMQGAGCGTIADDGCGKPLDCGACTGNKACTANNACVFAGLASCDGCPPGWLEIASSCVSGCTSGTESYCVLPGYDGKMVCGTSCPAGYHDWGGGPSNWTCTCGGSAMLCLKS